MRMVESQRL